MTTNNTTPWGEEINNETGLATVSTTQLGMDIETDIISRKSTFCSLVPKTDEEKRILFNAANSPDNTLKDCVNMTISLKHVYAEEVIITDENTGERITVPRMVLIDKDGVSYGCASFGVYNGIKKLMQTFGTPDTWKSPLDIQAKLVNKGANKSILTITLAPIKSK